jgi:hypothetical protein
MPFGLKKQGSFHADPRNLPALTAKSSRRTGKYSFFARRRTRRARAWRCRDALARPYPRRSEQRAERGHAIDFSVFES